MSSNRKKKTSNKSTNIPVRRARPVLLVLTLTYLAIVLAMPYTDPSLLIHALFCYAPPQLLSIPLAIFAIISLFLLIKKRFAKIQVLTLTSIIISLPFIFSFEINPLKPAHEKPNLRVLTCNILFTTEEVPELAEYIKKNNVDLLFLQENKGGLESPAEYLKRRLPDYHLYADGSAAILSRWPLSETRSEVQISNHQRRIISAKVNAPTPFRAATMHWSVPQIRHGIKEFKESVPRQLTNSKQLLEFLDGEQLPLVFGGDFNNTPRHGLTRIFSQKYTNAFSTVGSGPGFTFASDIPMVRIDHLYSNNKIIPVYCSPGPSFRSDHFSLLGDFEIQR